MIPSPHYECSPGSYKLNIASILCILNYSIMLYYFIAFSLGRYMAKNSSPIKFEFKPSIAYPFYNY